MDRDNRPTSLSRRNVLVAGAGTVVGAAAVAACGDGSASSAHGTSSAGAGTSTTVSTGAGSSSAASGGSSLAKVSDIPVGGAVSATDDAGKPVIVSRPKTDEVVAFSAVCTHMGCTVAPAGHILQCPCHGSTYDLVTGRNTGGPAPSPLARVPVRVRDGNVIES